MSEILPVATVYKSCTNIWFTLEFENNIASKVQLYVTVQFMAQSSKLKMHIEKQKTTNQRTKSHKASP